MPEGGEHTKIS